VIERAERTLENDQRDDLYKKDREMSKTEDGMDKSDVYDVRAETV